MKKFFIVLLVLASISFISCAEDSSDDGNSSGDASASAVQNSVINIPSCVSGGELSRADGESSDEIVENVYDAIRWTLYGVEQWSEFATEIVAGIETDILSAADSGDWTNDSPEGDDDITRVVWGPASDSLYETHVEGYFTKNGEELKALDVLLTIDGDKAKGLVSVDLANTPDEDGEEEEAKITIEFDGTLDTKTLTIKAVNLEDEEDEDSPSKVIAKAWLSADGIFKVSASYYFPEFTLDDEADAQGEERSYTFTIVGYDEKYEDTSRNNRAILKLAIPTTDATDATLFTEYSVGAVFKEYFYTLLRSQLAYDEFDIEQTVQDWEDLINQVDPDANIEFSDGSKLASQFPEEDLDKLLAWFVENSDEETAQDFQDFFFLADLVNPAYFDADGFVGTFDGEDGTLSAVPDWVDSSVLDIDSLDDEIILPGEFSDDEDGLSWDEDNFIVN